MKNFLCLLVLLATLPASAQFVSKFRGDYVGVMQATAKCSNERTIVSIRIDADGTITGRIVDFAGNEITTFKGQLAPNGKGFTQTGDPTADDFDQFDPRVGWIVKFSASASGGTLRGTIDGRGKDFCRYSFAAFRRYKIAQ